MFIVFYLNVNWSYYISRVNISNIIQILWEVLLKNCSAAQRLKSSNVGVL